MARPICNCGESITGELQHTSGSKRKTYHVNMLQPYTERQDKADNTEEEMVKHDTENNTEASQKQAVSNDEDGEAQEGTTGDDKDDDGEFQDENSENEQNGDEPHIAASMVLKDGDCDVDHTELIEVCPLTSSQSWEDVMVNDQLSATQKADMEYNINL